jgi:hypothetical protein
VEKIRLSELNAKVIREFKEHLTVARLKDQPERYLGLALLFTYLAIRIAWEMIA